MPLAYRALFIIIVTVGSLIITVLHYQTISELHIASHNINRVSPPSGVTPLTSKAVMYKVRLHSNRAAFDTKQQDLHLQLIDEPVVAPNQILRNMLRADGVHQQKAATDRSRSIADVSFQRLGNSNYLIYSAHYDDIHRVVKFVGFGPMSDEHSYLEQLQCLIENNSNMHEYVQFSVYYRISTYYPWEGQKYDSFVFQCNTTVLSPSFTRIVTKIDQRMTAEFQLMSKSSTSTHKFAVCVEPLVLKYNDTLSIKHYIAVNTLFGAEHFYFYVSDVTPEVERLLQDLPMVTIYKWPLGHLSKETHAFGQKAASAHCLYNHRHSSKYLLFIDIDEVMVPKIGENWSFMVDNLSHQQLNRGAIVFQSRLFPRNAIPAAVDNFTRDHQLWSLEYTQTVGIFSLYQWSKVLVDTHRTDIVDIHKVRKMISGYKAINADPSVGVVHHYRNYNLADTTAQLYEDNYMSKYKSNITKLYQSMFQ